MSTSVSSEIWQDQFLSTICADIFVEDQDHETLDENSNTKSQGQDSHGTAMQFIASKAEPKESVIKNPVDFLDGERTYAIECLMSSSVDLVGMQVWRGALLLSDYILSHTDEFYSKNILELAAGTGITSIVASELASSVICTDVDRGDILSTIRRNFELNHDLVKSDFQIEEIDFFQETWQTKLSNVLEKTQVILVADVVYDPLLTEKFFSSLEHILCQTVGDVTVYFSIEKRVRVDQCGSIQAPNFDMFTSMLESLSKKLPVKLESIRLNFNQRLKCYERVEEMFMWKLSWEKKVVKT